MKINRRTSKPARIEMLPLIDIVFLLLVFFIYAMLSMAVHRGLQLDLPESSQAEVNKESPISLSIRCGLSGELDIFVNDRPLALTKLDQLLLEFKDTPESSPVLVFAEENITYQQLYLVLDALKKNGYRNISLQANLE